MFALPTVKDLMQRARSAFRANLKGSDAWLWPNNVYVSAKVIAGMTFEVIGFMSYVSRQKFAVTAPDLDSLLLHGDEFGIPIRPATPAQGRITITADASGVQAQAGAILQRLDNVEYVVVDGGGRSNAGTLQLAVISVSDGKVNNAIEGTPLTFVSGVTSAGAPTAAVGPGDIALGSDVEDIESYRARILFRKRNPPHGGAASDYVMWAEAVSGVSRVFVERLWNGPGSVRVFFLMDDVYPNGIPGAADVVRVRNHIDTVKPAGVELTVAAPVAHPLNITIAGLSPNTTAVHEAIIAELRDMFLRRSRVAGNDTEHPGMPFLATPVTFSRSWIWQAIANASGEDRCVLVSPNADIPLLRTEIATLGTVTFI